MSNPRMLETVAAELRRQGLPAADVARLLQELKDHVADLFAEQGGLMDEQMHVNDRIESRLGRPEVLVAAALANRRQASVFGRHPILSTCPRTTPCFWHLFLGEWCSSIVGRYLGASIGWLGTRRD